MKSGWLRVILAVAAGTCASGLLHVGLVPLAAIVLFILASPLARDRRVWFVGDVEGELAIVSRRREEALRALKDLEDDRHAGKITQELFEEQRPLLLEAAKQATREMDDVQQKRTAARKRIEESLAVPSDA